MGPPVYDNPIATIPFLMKKVFIPESAGDIFRKIYVSGGLSMNYLFGDTAHGNWLYP